MKVLNRYTEKINENSPYVCLVILNYKGYEDTCSCIDSVKKLTYSNYSIIVVDNYSQDGSYEKLKKRYSDISIIQTGRNLGYAGGNNVGIRYAIDLKAKYVCVINNDIKAEKDFLGILVNTMETEGNIAVIGPAICEWDSDLVQSAGVMLNYYNAQSQIIKRGSDYKNINSNIIECDYICGACMLVRSSLIEINGFIPENYFLFFEETEWCVRFKRRGFRVCCMPGCRIWHKESATIDKQTELKEYFQERNRIMFEKRNATKFQFCVFSVYVIIQTLYRCIITKMKYIHHIPAILDGFNSKMSEKYKHLYVSDNNMRKSK